MVHQLIRNQVYLLKVGWVRSAMNMLQIHLIIICLTFCLTILVLKIFLGISATKNKKQFQPKQIHYEISSFYSKRIHRFKDSRLIRPHTRIFLRRQKKFCTDNGNRQ